MKVVLYASVFLFAFALSVFTVCGIALIGHSAHQAALWLYSRSPVVESPGLFAAERHRAIRTYVCTYQGCTDIGMTKKTGDGVIENNAILYTAGGDNEYVRSGAMEYSISGNSYVAYYSFGLADMIDVAKTLDTLEQKAIENDTVTMDHSFATRKHRTIPPIPKDQEQMRCVPGSVPYTCSYGDWEVTYQ